jgi:ribose transport system permease protein
MREKLMSGLENALRAKQRGINIVQTILRKREAGIVLALLLMSLAITAVAPRFASGQNFYLLSRQISLLAIVAMGEFFTILTGGIDLSVGSLIGVSGITCGLALAAGVPPLLAILIGLATGFCAGLLSGWLVSYAGLTPFIPTLGMLSMARGVIWVITKGWPITDIPKQFLFIGRGDVLGIPFPVIIMFVLGIAAHVVLRYTVLGRRIFAIGGNEQATFLSGIDVKKIKFFVYGISGFFAAVTGIIMVARFDSAQAAMGTGWELDAIASAVIGGASLTGGAGSMMGVFIGATIIGVIQNGLVLMKVSAYWQTLIIGAIIILAATLDRLKNK